MITFSDFTKYKLLEVEGDQTGSGGNPAPVAQATPDKTKEPLPGLIKLKEKIVNLREKVTGKKAGKDPGDEQQGGGVSLKKDVNIAIDSKTGEKYELNFVEIKQEKDGGYLPLYSVKTDNQNMLKYIKNYTFLESNLYKNVRFIYQTLSKWYQTVTSSASAPPPVQTNRSQVNPEVKKEEPVQTSQNSEPVKKEELIGASNITRYSEFLKLFEVDEKQSAMTQEKFNNSPLYMFVNSSVFGKYENFQGVLKALNDLKVKNPDLYKKTYKDFAQMKNSFLPESKKSIQMWCVIKLDTKLNKYLGVDAGDEIKSGDTIAIRKMDNSFTTKGFKITSIKVKQKQF